MLQKNLTVFQMCEMTTEGSKGRGGVPFDFEND